MLPEHVFKIATEGTSVGVLITDNSLPENPIVYCNPHFQYVTGYDESEVLGKSCKFLQGFDSSEETVMKIRNAIKNNTVFKGEILNYRKDGSHFWNQLTISPVRDLDGEVRYFIGIQHDITMQKEAELKRDSLIEDLKSVNYGLSHFASMASHEIKTPLGVVHGFAELLKQDYWDALDNDGKGYLDRIISNSEYLNNCVTELLALTSLSYSNPKFCSEDLNQIAREASRFIEGHDSESYITITNELPASVICNRQLMIQVFNNLYSNAFKYGMGKEKGVFITNVTKLENNYYEIKVFDNGCGVNSEILNNLFDPFITSNKVQKQGVGLGLAIVKKIMEKHEGSIQCDTSEKGTAFILKIPKLLGMSAQS